MKKIILFALLSISAFTIAQEIKVKEVPSFRKNEVKLNALYLILGAFDGTYERSVNTESAFGVSLTFLLDNENDIERVFAISPYYRLYFGKKPVSGFFVEGFGLYQAVSNETYYYNFDPNSPSNNTVVTVQKLEIWFKYNTLFINVKDTWAYLLL